MEIKNLKDVKRTENWRVLIYGKPGIGKTSTIKNLKGKTLVLDMDHSSKVLGGSDIDVVEFDRTHPSNSITEFIKLLNDVSKNYQNIVIDNISSFEKDWFVEQGRNSKSGIRNELQDYSAWTNYFQRIITAIFATENVNVLVTAWENQREITAMTGQMFNQYAPQIRDSVRDTLLGLVDVAGRIILNPQTGNRGVILEGDDSIFAKNRLDNRKAASVEDLFKFGNKKESEVDDVQTAPVPNEPGKQSKTKDK